MAYVLLKLSWRVSLTARTRMTCVMQRRLRSALAGRSLSSADAWSLLRDFVEVCSLCFCRCDDAPSTTVLCVVVMVTAREVTECVPSVRAVDVHTMPPRH
jgi:hypothetical protein